MILWNYNNKVKCYYGIILRLYMSFAMHKIVLTYTVDSLLPTIQKVTAVSKYS